MPKTPPPPPEPEAPAKPQFVSVPFTELPKRDTPRSAPDLETANALLAIVSGTSVVNGETVANTATDGVTYPDADAARKAALAAKRRLEYVAPDGKRVKSRVWPLPGKDGAFVWAVFLADKPATAAPAADATATAPAEAPKV